MIGRFGIGFVSVYQITDVPQISSGGIKITLNPITGDANGFNVKKSQGSKFELPFAFDASSPIRTALEASAISKTQLDTLEYDISMVAENSLLFL